MIKIAIIGLVTVMVSLMLKNSKPEYAILAGISGGIIVFSFSADKLESIIRMLNSFKDNISVNTEYIFILFKIIGITYIAEFTSDICRDAGYTGISTQIELAAKLCIMSMSVPVLMAIINTINTLFTGG